MRKNTTCENICKRYHIQKKTHAEKHQLQKMPHAKKIRHATDTKCEKYHTQTIAFVKINTWKT